MNGQEWLKKMKEAALKNPIVVVKRKKTKNANVIEFSDGSAIIDYRKDRDTKPM